MAAEDKRDGWNMSGLFGAVRAGDRREADELIDRGADVNACMEGVSALGLAVGEGNHDMMALLLSRGANPSATTRKGSGIWISLLEAAALEGDARAMEILLASGANPDGAGTGTGTGSPLHATLSAGRMACDPKERIRALEALLSVGADVNLNANGRSALAMSAERNWLDEVGMFLKYGADPNARGGGGTTPLMLAALQDAKMAAELLIRGGARVDDVDDRGMTAVHYACQNGMGTMALDVLLDNGASPGREMAGGVVPLHLAIASKNILAMESLLAAGADSDGGGPGTSSPLALAVSTGHSSERMTGLLLGNGADPNGRVEGGRGDASFRTSTILSKAIMERASPGVVERLLAAGADPNARGVGGRTALMWAARDGGTAVSRMLLAAGADGLVADENGMTALHHAAWGGADGWADEFFDVCDPLAVTNAGSTAAEVAEDEGYRELAQMLSGVIRALGESKELDESTRSPGTRSRARGL